MQSQKQRILNYLESHDTISQLEATRLFGATRLSAIVFNVREEFGFDMISSIWVEEMNRYGVKTRFVRYKLNKKKYKKVVKDKEKNKK